MIIVLQKLFCLPIIDILFTFLLNECCDHFCTHRTHTKVFLGKQTLLKEIWNRYISMFDVVLLIRNMILSGVR